MVLFPFLNVQTVSMDNSTILQRIFWFDWDYGQRLVDENEASKKNLYSSVH